MVWSSLIILIIHRNMYLIWCNRWSLSHNLTHGTINMWMHRLQNISIGQLNPVCHRLPRILRNLASNLVCIAWLMLNRCNWRKTRRREARSWFCGSQLLCIRICIDGAIRWWSFNNLIRISHFIIFNISKLYSRRSTGKRTNIWRCLPLPNKIFVTNYN